MNFISSNSEPADIPNLFGDMNGNVDVGEEFAGFGLTDTLAHLTVRLGVFPSLGQARKNGWGGEIPYGFNEFHIGKRTFWVWKRQYSTQELDEMFPVDTLYLAGYSDDGTPIYEQ